MTDEQMAQPHASSRVPASLTALRRLLRALAPQSGLARVTSHPLVRRACARLHAPVLADLVDGRVLPVRLTDSNGRMLYLFGTYDPKVITTCRALLRPGDVFLDIGANHGEVGLLCASAVRPGGEVHLFEPLPVHVDMLRTVLRGESLGGIEVHGYGMADRDVIARFLVPGGHTGLARPVGDSSTPAAGSVMEVPLRNTSAVLEEVVAGRPFGAKVDIEGSEDVVVPLLLAAPSVRFVVFEWEHVGDKVGFAERVRGLGFELLGLEKRIWSPRLLPIRCLEGEDFADTVAIRSGAVASRLVGRSLHALSVAAREWR